MGVLLDIEDGGEIHITFAGITTQRVAIVDQLDGSDPDEMLYDALLTLAAEATPIVVGAAHPTIPDIVITDMHGYPIKGCARARVELVYGVVQYQLPATPGTDGPETKSCRTFSEAKDYTTDPKDSGTDLVVSAPPKYSGLPDQIKTVSIRESRTVIVFERTEPAMPTARQRTYQNRVNSVALGTGGLYPIGTVYCDVINGDKQGDGDPLVHYEFIYNADGHAVEYKWESPPLVVPAYDANSRKTIEPDEADFTALGFDWDD